MNESTVIIHCAFEISCRHSISIISMGY